MCHVLRQWQKSGRRLHNATTSGNLWCRHSRKQVLTLGAWNVYTTNDSDSSLRLEGATALICRELEKGNIDMCALSEVRRPGVGNRDFKIRGRGGFWNVVTEESLGRERRCKRGKNEVKSCNATKNNTT